MRVFGMFIALATAMAISGCERADDRAAAANVPKFNVNFCQTSLDSPSQIRGLGCMASPNHAFVMTLTSTGGLAIARLVDGAVGRPVWTVGGDLPLGRHAWAALQSDGNVVIYDENTKPLWNAGTYGAIAPYHLDLTDGGELILRGPAGVLWSSKAGKTPAPVQPPPPA